MEVSGAGAPVAPDRRLASGPPEQAAKAQEVAQRRDDQQAQQAQQAQEAQRAQKAQRGLSI